MDLPTDPLYIIFDKAVDGWLYPPTSTTPAYDGQGVAMLVEWVSRVYAAVAVA